MAKTLLVRKKGYRRKAYTRRTRTGRRIRVKAARVPASRFKIRDRGALGRGPKVVPKLKVGTLGGKGFFSKPTAVRRKRLAALAKRIGEKKVQGKLQAIAVFSKRVNPALAKKATADRRWVAGSFIGKKRVKTGTGFRRKKR